MVKIEKTEDRTLDAIIKCIIRCIYKKKDGFMLNNRYNRLNKIPRINFVGVNHITLRCDEYFAVNGALTDEMARPAEDRVLFCEVRVGIGTGDGIGYKIRNAPLKKIRSLAALVDESTDKASLDAIKDYYKRLGDSCEIADEVMMQLAEVEPSVDISSLTKNRRTPNEHIKRTMERCSKIITEADGVERGEVKFELWDEERRYASSNGAAILVPFKGYHFKLKASVRDKDGKKFEYYRSLCLLAEDFNSDNLENAAEEFKKLVSERYDAEEESSKRVVCYYEPEAISNEFHEAIAHLFSSDEILSHSTSSFNHLTINEIVAPKKLSVIVNPGMKNRWGSYYYDYEGVKSRKVELIKNGRHVGFIADRHGAKLLTERCGREIYPGSSITQVLTGNESDFFRPSPRITNLDIKWRGKNVDSDVWNIFLKCIKESDQEYGLWLKGGGPSYVSTEDGNMVCRPMFAYRVDKKGQYDPIKPILTHNHPMTFFNNIVVIGSNKKYVAHRCGGDDLADTRAGILVGPAVVKDVEITPVVGPKYGR